MKKPYKKGYWKKTQQGGTKADQALRIAKKVDKKQKQSTELSISSSGNVSGTLSAGATLTHIDVGTSASVDLSGTEAYLKGVRIKGFIQANSTTPERWRMDVVLDRRPVPGTIATFTEIYTMNNDINSLVKHNNITRFKILASERGYVNTADVGHAFFDRHVKLNLRICTKINGSYTQANQNKNAILVMLMTNATANQPTYAYQIRTVVLDD